MPRSARLLLVVLAAGCARIEFGAAGGVNEGGGGASPTTGGASDGGSNQAGGGGEPQGGAINPCPGVPEICNGIDDDCDGVADEPDTFPATDVCDDCDWIEFEGRPYASCPTPVGPPEAVNCPAGMRIVVLQSMAEHDALLDLVLQPDIDGYVGMRQADGSPERDTGWQWFREGMPPPWFSSGAVEPDDYTPGGFEPIAIENDSENCAGLYNYDDVFNNRGFVDSDCVDAFERVLCEPIADECIQGAACLLDLGCTGTFDCALPVGSQCVAVPSGETCDGKDNSCNGTVDEGVCGCVDVTDPATMRAYKKCSASVGVVNARCPPGFRLAMPETAAEATFLNAQVVGGEALWLGLYQKSTATQLDQDWFFYDGSPLVIPFWAGPQPNDGDDVENGQQNCANMESNGGHDGICTEMNGYLCEEL